MEKAGFIRRDKLGKETWRNDFNDRIIFDTDYKAVKFKDETGECFPIDKELLLNVIEYIESKGW